jgi:UDP-2,3-diacylglucosamine pyrophosphatase LpxH
MRLQLTQEMNAQPVHRTRSASKPVEPESQTVCVVSDLHLFSKRTHAHLYLGLIYEAASESDFFILNGDTFDFRWSTLETRRDTILQALHWLETFSRRVPTCRIHFILGNHDYERGLIDALPELTEQLPNLAWHPFHLRLGSNIFLHGDVANSTMTVDDLANYRRTWLHDRSRGKVLNFVHDRAFDIGLHKAVSRLAFPPRRVARRIYAYLKDVGEDILDGAKDIYFGHTHVPISGYVYRGLRFHNCGAPIRGLEFSMLRTRIPRENGQYEED